MTDDDRFVSKDVYVERHNALKYGMLVFVAVWFSLHLLINFRLARIKDELEQVHTTQTQRTDLFKSIEDRLIQLEKR